MRKVYLRDCAPEWIERDGVRRAISFACPESDGGCNERHRVPINGSAACSWGASGEIPSVTLIPSIACRGPCRMHITVAAGAITFEADSKSGPDWNSKQ